MVAAMDSLKQNHFLGSNKREKLLKACEDSTCAGAVQLKEEEEEEDEDEEDMDEDCSSESD